MAAPACAPHVLVELGSSPEQGSGGCSPSTAAREGACRKCGKPEVGMGGRKRTGHSVIYLPDVTEEDVFSSLFLVFLHIEGNSDWM